MPQVVIFEAFLDDDFYYKLITQKKNNETITIQNSYTRRS
jgi:hypothetical protein